MSVSKTTEHFYAAASTLPTDASVYSHIASGDLMKAFEDAEEALRERKQNGTRVEVAAATVTSAEADLACGEAEQAYEKAQEALKLAQSASNTKLEALAMNVIAKALASWNSDDAMVKAKDAADVAKACGDAHAVACVQDTLARTYLQTGQGGQAIVIAKDTANMLRASDPNGEGCALLCIAELQMSTGDFKGAMSTAKNAAETLEKAGNAAGQALAVARSASAALSTANYVPEGFELADKALALLDSAGEKSGQIPLKLDMARAKLDAEAYIEAEDLAEEAQQTAKSISDLNQEAASALLLATIRLNIAVEDAKDKPEADTVTATEAARDALFLFRKLGDRLGEAAAMRKLAQVRYQSGARDMAKMAAEEAQTMFRELGDPQGEAESVLLIAHVMHTDDHLDSAKRFATKAFALFESIQDGKGMESCTEFLDKLKLAQSEKIRTEKAAKKTVSDSGLVKLVTSVDETSHLLSYFADMNEDEDTELGEFDLNEWGSAMNMLKIH